MTNLKIILTFDLDPPTFSSELRVVDPQNYSDEIAILKLKLLISMLEEKLDSIIPVTIFLRNATIESGFLIDHSICANLRVIKASHFKKLELGLHPHINNCVLSNSKSAEQLTQNLKSNFKLLEENGFKKKMIRFGGNYKCGAITRIIQNLGVQINSSEIFGRDTNYGTHFSECSTSAEVNISRNDIYNIPMSTTFITNNQTKKRVYFDFSFKNVHQRDFDSLNIERNNPYIVAISHPATFFENVYGETDKYEFGINHWLASFLQTYKELSIKFKNITFEDISIVGIKI